MTVDQTGRGWKDDEEDDDQLKIDPTSAANAKVQNIKIAEQKKEEIKIDQQNFIDLDSMFSNSNTPA